MRMILFLLISLMVVYALPPVNAIEMISDEPPVAVISEPRSDGVYLEGEDILFDGSTSIDNDTEVISYSWVAGNRSILGESATFMAQLGWGHQIITLYVSDGTTTSSATVEVTVLQDPAKVDTDGDTTPDDNDEDSDGDGLKDSEEDLNLNGLMDPGETDPLNRDTDRDGISDKFDEHPLDPYTPPDDEENLTIEAFILIITSMVLIAGIKNKIKSGSR